MHRRRNNQVATRLNGSTKEIIEKKAIKLFATKGYNATSMREIAEAAKISKPVIYYYFRNKEQLCHHIISSGLDKFHRILKEVCEAEASDVFEQIVQMVNIHFEFCKRHIEFMRFIYAINFGPDRYKIDYDFFSYGMELFRMQVALMRRAGEAGLIRAGKEEDAVHYVRGIISTFVMLYVDRRGELTPNLAGTIVSDMIHGLGAVYKTGKASGAVRKC